MDKKVRKEIDKELRREEYAQDIRRRTEEIKMLVDKVVLRAEMIRNKVKEIEEVIS